MADITWADVEAIAPGLSTVPVTAQTMILAYVEETVDENAFIGDASYKLARVLLAAHRGAIVLSSSSGSGLAVSSESGGGISRSYAASSSGDDLMSTQWGREYTNLVRNSPARAPIIF